MKVYPIKAFTQSDKAAILACKKAGLINFGIVEPENSNQQPILMEAYAGKREHTEHFIYPIYGIKGNGKDMVLVPLDDLE
jgi:hypothetical protein